MRTYYHILTCMFVFLAICLSVSTTYITWHDMTLRYDILLYVTLHYVSLHSYIYIHLQTSFLALKLNVSWTTGIQNRRPSLLSQFLKTNSTQQAIIQFQNRTVMHYSYYTIMRLLILTLELPWTSNKSEKRIVKPNRGDSPSITKGQKVFSSPGFRGLHVHLGAQVLSWKDCDRDLCEPNK